MATKSPVRGFVAFPSTPPTLMETITEGIRKLNETELVHLVPWTDMSIGGKYIIGEICSQIDAAPLFVADITNQNPNVLFELGYAIAKKKRIWLLQDCSTDAAKDRRVKVGLFDTIGYAEYTNSDQIVQRFLEDKPYEDLRYTPFLDQAIHVENSETGLSDLFYLRSYTATEASIRLWNYINKASLNVIVDDPSEKSQQTISWYAKHVKDSGALLVHLASDDVSDASATNAKYSSIAGLAHGMGKRVLILAHEPYSCPLDYKHLLARHRTANHCLEIASPWVDEVRELGKQHRKATTAQRRLEHNRLFLSSLNLGEHVAENEVNTLQEYFVKTGPYQSVLNSRLCLFIGRKGTGKTANLYQAAKELGSDKRNHVCVIKPSAYETESVLISLKNLRTKAEMGGVYESLWKYMVYSELCISVIEALDRRIKSTLNDDELQFLEWCESEQFRSKGDFSVRLQERVEVIENDVEHTWKGTQPVKLAEHLHSGIIPKMRQMLGNVLRDKKRVVVLVDNLDKAWKTRSDIDELCELLLGFLTVMTTITTDFGKNEHWRSPIQLSLTAFLRSDIYSHLVRAAREPDKLKMERIPWDDTEMLLRVMTERFVYNNDQITESTLWSKVFSPQTENMPTSDYIVKSIYPRPRDIIVLAQKALSLAVSRGHESIESADVKDARKEYSEYAFNSVNVEDANGIGTVERGTYALIGSSAILSESELLSALAHDGIDGDLQKKYIQAMCRLSVLGLELRKDQFEYIYDDAEYERIFKLADTYTEQAGDRRFKVHPALQPHLGITD